MFCFVFKKKRRRRRKRKDILCCLLFVIGFFFAFRKVGKEKTPTHVCDVFYIKAVAFHFVYIIPFVIVLKIHSFIL